MQASKLILMGYDPDEMDVSLARCVTSQAFNAARTGDEIGYRDAAINKLIALKLAWDSEQNITYDVFRRFVIIKCPYCGYPMQHVNGGGSATECTVTYQCKRKRCQARAHITVRSMGGIGFEPPQQEDKDEGKTQLQNA